MMPNIDIRLNIVPPTATAQQKGVFVRNGRAQFFVKAKVREAENFLAAILRPFAPLAPFTGAVELRATWCFPYRKSEPKWRTAGGAYLPHTTRPDLDNLEKGLLDTMTRLRFWLDDSQVAQKKTNKAWGESPFLEIHVREIAAKGVQ